MNALFKWFHNRSTVIKVLIYAIGFSSWAHIFDYLLSIDRYIDSFIGDYFIVMLGSISIINLVVFIFAISYVIAEESKCAK